MGKSSDAFPSTPSVFSDAYERSGRASSSSSCVSTACSFFGPCASSLRDSALSPFYYINCIRGPVTGREGTGSALHHRIRHLSTPQRTRTMAGEQRFVVGARIIGALHRDTPKLKVSLDPSPPLYIYILIPVLFFSLTWFVILIWCIFFNLIWFRFLIWFHFFLPPRCSWYQCHGLMRPKSSSTGHFRISRNSM